MICRSSKRGSTTTHQKRRNKQRNWNLDAASGFNACASEPESELCGKQAFPLLNIIMIMSETALEL